MNTHLIRAAGPVLLAMLALGAWAAPATAGVTTTFVQAQNYQDMPFSPIDREQILKSLGEHFAKLGQALPPDQDLAIDVKDIDLAGRLVPNFRAGQDIRVLHGGADWPHMTLHYTLSSHGQVLAAGDEQLSDMDYLNRISTYSDGDPLRFEKRMIDDWFKKKFLAARKG